MSEEDSSETGWVIGLERDAAQLMDRVSLAVGLTAEIHRRIAVQQADLGVPVIPPIAFRA